MNQLPQLRMRHDLTFLPASRPFPDGYELRAARTSDAEAISAVLAVCFDDVWTAERVLAELLISPTVPASYVIVHDGLVVASASYQIKTEPDPVAGWLHYVGVHPDVRGQALGERLSRHVLAEAIARKRSCVYLTTDDFRLPAIRTYFRLGFQPDNWHDSHPGRWQAVLESLGSPP